MLNMAETPFRYHEFLFEQWNKLCFGRAFPMLNEIDMEVLAKIADYCFIVELGSRSGVSGHSFLYRGAGLSVTEGDDAEAINFLFANERSPLDARLDKVELSGKPLIENSEFINSKNQIMRYRRCLLPLGDGSGHVGYVIGCVRWRAFDGRQKKYAPKSGWDDPKIR